MFKKLKKLVLCRNEERIEVLGQQNYTEVLLNNRIENNLQALLLPLNILQNIFCVPKYRIRDNYITPNSFTSQCLCFLGTSLYVSLYGYQIYQLTVRNTISTDVTRFTSAINISHNIIHVITCLLVYIVTQRHSNDNIQFLIKIQNVYRTTKFDRKHLKNLTIWNWVYVIIIICNSIMMHAYFHARLKYFDLIELILDIYKIGLGLNIIYSVSMLKLITSTTYSWLEDVNQKKEREDYVSYWKNMSSANFDILESYCHFKKAFEELVSILLKNGLHRRLHVDY